MRLVVFLVTTALLSAAFAAPNDAQATSNCGTFNSAGAAVRAMTRGHGPCSTARRILRRYLSSTARCSGSACVRRDFGWVCATASATAFPRLASCSRGRSVIAAYSAAD